MSDLASVQQKLAKIRTRTDLKIRPTTLLKQTFTDFDGSEKPLRIRYYQIQGMLHLILMKRFLLGDDTGLGKTLEAIGALCYIWEKDPNRKVVIFTTKSAVPQWVGEFSKFTTGVKAIICKGTPSQREQARRMWESAKGPAVIVMGYRSAVQDIRHIQSWSDFILITDEATAYKNPKTQVHQMVRHMGGQADRLWALTATLIKNNLMEGHGIYQVVCPGLFGSQRNFMMYYCLTRMQPVGRGRQVPVVVGYSPDKIAEFKAEISPYYLGRPKHEVATELPVLISRVLEVPLVEDQEDKYDDALAGLLEMGDGDLREVSKLTALIYCQEIVNHLELIAHKGKSEKMDMLLEMLTTGDFAEEKVIVYSRFSKMVDVMMPLLKKEKLHPVRITGAEKEDDRKKAQDLFQDPNSDCRVICITDAGSDAINLQAAKALVCYDTPWSAGQFIQLVGRMIRIGSIHDRCYVNHLVAKRTRGQKRKSIDHRVIEVLNKKMRLVEAVLGKRLKGEGDSTSPISADNDISDIFQALRDDAQAA
mgnify:CR=1 FL=1